MAGAAARVAGDHHLHAQAGALAAENVFLILCGTDL
jgi:hypothetical protein